LPGVGIAKTIEELEVQINEWNKLHNLILTK
jgi:hypothetical protein